MKRPTTTAAAAPPAPRAAAAPAAPKGGPVAASRESAAAPRPRADAVRNRERILAAAREAFVEFGSAAPLDEVARRAGIGNATLYRHFPDRDTLVHHVVLFTTERVAASARAALAEEPDAFAALCRFTHSAADERIGALCPMLADGFDRDHPELLAARTALAEAVETLLAAGREAGLVRADIGAGDLMIALSQLSRPLPGTACFDTDRFAHRHLQLFLDGLRAPARSELPGSAATLEDLTWKTT
ncbi:MULTISPECIES: TetR/AcrR family transcriptional regulator [Streptomyces]|uniref:TetR family transcriptional regulator n=1 Tax=Streptomyces amritsarensis TaxID=681158 RepID=A0ABX3G5Z7_9ACTN|nr:MULTISPECIES: TetR/AcrR family transcriptional regulator [Streptomyces]MDX6763951.1 TetR/AcrR family transcriptional regulator [Streptomyces sp. F8]OLZ67959.1 TetR family transcriptional regulator [Streptomyces amritsarensis]